MLSNPPLGMASRAFKNKFRKTCCSFPVLPRIRGKPSDKLSWVVTPVFWNWCSTKLAVSRMMRFRSTSTNSVGEVREKLSREFTISLARNVCFAIFSSNFDFCSSPETCLASICVGGNDRERRIHFMGNSGREQANRAEFVCLHEPPFELFAVSDIVEDNQAPNLCHLLGD